jgi:hypothetical protein
MTYQKFKAEEMRSCCFTCARTYTYFSVCRHTILIWMPLKIYEYGVKQLARRRNVTFKFDNIWQVREQQPVEYTECIPLFLCVLCLAWFPPGNILCRGKRRGLWPTFLSEWFTLIISPQGRTITVMITRKSVGSQSTTSSDNGIRTPFIV